MSLDRIIPIHVPRGEASEDLVERHPTLEPSQGGAKAIVDAIGERYMPVDPAGYVEALPRSSNWRSSRLADAMSMSTTLPASTLAP